MRHAVRALRLAAFLLCLVFAMTACASDTSSPSSKSSTASAAAWQPDSVQVPEGFDLQGHRGARGLQPENTIPAFRTALDLGVTTLELDVVISADGKVVVSHEPWMNPDICLTPDGERIPENEARDHNLYELTYDEIAAYDCGSLQNPRFPEQETTPASKPLLSDVIGMAEAYADSTGRPPVFYNVETKSRPDWEGAYQPAPDVFARAVLDVLRETGVAARSTVQSFDPRTLQVAYDDGANVRLALLVGDRFDQGFADNLEMLSFVPPIYSPAYSLVDADLIETAHARGVQVIPWTVNEKDAMRRLLDLGVDGLITDYPNRAVEVRAERRETN